MSNCHAAAVTVATGAHPSSSIRRLNLMQGSSIPPFLLIVLFVSEASRVS